MTDDPKSPFEEVVDKGERIYSEKYKQEFERKYMGQFAVIDVNTGIAYHGEFPELALEEARKQAPGGLFHLIRVGAPGAYRVSYTSHHAKGYGLFR